MATAGLFLSEKSLLISLSKELIERPDLNIPDCPIIPDSLNAGIIVVFPNKKFNIETTYQKLY